MRVSTQKGGVLTASMIIPLPAKKINPLLEKRGLISKNSIFVHKVGGGSAGGRPPAPITFITTIFLTSILTSTIMGQRKPVIGMAKGPSPLSLDNVLIYGQTKDKEKCIGAKNRTDEGEWSACLEKTLLLLLEKNTILIR